MSWSVAYKVKGLDRMSRMTLGTYPGLSLKEARDKAHEIYSQARQGRDPHQEQRLRQKAFEAERKAPRVVDLCKEYMERWAKKYKAPRSITEDQRIINREIIPVIGKKKVKSIKRRDILRLLDAIADRGSLVMANRTKALLSKMFNFACERDIIDASPVTNIKPYVKEISRDRVLTEDEIRIFWQGTEMYLSQLMRDIFRLLLITGQRRGEVMGMKCEEVNLDKALWTIPGIRSKNGQPHVVPLSNMALTILRERPFSNEYVFPGTKGKVSVENSGPAMTRLRRGTGLDFRLHDLRRTVATNLAALGCPQHVLKAILNHSTSNDVTSVYNRHKYDAEKRWWLDKWADKLQEILFILTKST